MQSDLEKARKALQRHLAKKGRGEASRLAKVIGCDLGLPKKWAMGDRTPEADRGFREALERETGISADWWRNPRPKRAPA